MVMQALVQSSERWRTAELSFNADEGLLMLSRANSPRLKTIVLSGDPSEMVAMDLLSVEGLRSITLRARHTSINPFLSYFRLRWDQLTHLSFGVPGLALKNVVPLLQKCLRLISFQMSIQGHYMDPLSLIVAPVSLACLEILIIIDEIEVSHIEFLLHHLKTLAVGDMWSMRVGGSEPEVGATYLIALLTPNPGSPLVGPQLEALEINEWATLGCDPQSDLLAFAQRRLDASPHFRRLDVKYAGVVLPIPQTLLQAFAARGLTITTTSNSYEIKLSSREMP
ncbi:hypothetical protein B0H13DRAFT_1878330 [Mycena leptocephala]|nr:hypothetical protein B0H13DRAFT_1878330 [Mycena leptocephala]